MPVYRDQNGRIIDSPTQQASNPLEQPTQVVRGSTPKPAQATPASPLDAATTVNRPGVTPAAPLAGQHVDTPTSRTPQGQVPPAASPSDGDPKTRVFRPGRATTAAPVSTGEAQPAAAAATAEQSSDAMADPLAGWLVITGGPGMGNALRLGYGVNAIGRDADQRIVLDFGDDQISRKQHALVTYDPKGRKFYLQHGGGTNLVYMNEAPVLTPTELTAGVELIIGATELRFMPLCGPDFDWQEKA
ncbi:FHA domain-containing protein [Corallincola spongiicola]|uniref:FHA domain-containing protein n=1 Tax=Corallincola spongiicola TaxID=2520508 RepID=UPI001A92059C|nr:FHA domain-containing protein [Corallincola spongiicola]